MPKKIKVKFKRGKVKIKLKGDDAMPVRGEDVRQLLGAVLQRTVPLADVAAAPALAQPEAPVALQETADESKEPA